MDYDAVGDMGGGAVGGGMYGMGGMGSMHHQQVNHNEAETFGRNVELADLQLS